MDQMRPPIVPYDGAPAAGAAETPDGDDEPTEGLPEHERDTDTTVGGGVLATGGTAVDRGTGTLDGDAQGRDPADEVEGADPVDPDEAVPSPYHRS
jgi:hypothetical protein